MGTLAIGARPARRTDLAAAAHLRRRQRARPAGRAHAAGARTGTCCSCSKTTICGARPTPRTSGWRSSCAARSSPSTSDYLDDRAFRPARAAACSSSARPTIASSRQLIEPDRSRAVRSSNRRCARASARGTQAAGAHRLASERAMIVLTGADLVLPDRILAAATLIIDDGRIVDDQGRLADRRAVAIRIPRPHHRSRIHRRPCARRRGHRHARRRRRRRGASPSASAAFGVTAFCPTTVACAPDALRRVLEPGAARARIAARRSRARVLPAHLESNFINPDYSGAQPATCLRAAGATHRCRRCPQVRVTSRRGDILDDIEAHAPDVGIVTLAPELDGGLDLDRVGSPSRASASRSAIPAATFEQGLGRHCRRRTPRHAPLQPHAAPPTIARRDWQARCSRPTRSRPSSSATAYHVHPRARADGDRRRRGRRGSWPLPTAPQRQVCRPGTQRRSAARPITVATCARLDDGTLAGSPHRPWTRRSGWLIGAWGCRSSTRRTMCATTPARELGLMGTGSLAVGAAARTWSFWTGPAPSCRHGSAASPAGSHDRNSAAAPRQPFLCRERPAHWRPSMRPSSAARALTLQACARSALPARWHYRAGSTCGSRYNKSFAVTGAPSYAQTFDGGVEVSLVGQARSARHRSSGAPGQAMRTRRSNGHVRAERAAGDAHRAARLEVWRPLGRRSDLVNFVIRATRHLVIT